MKRTALLLPALLFLFGCTSSIFQTEMSDSDYRKLYYDYKALVVEATKNKNVANLQKITDEYISETGKDVFLISVSQLDSSGKWNVLLHNYRNVKRKDEIMPIALPAIHYAHSDKVNVYRGKGFVLIETNEIKAYTYQDDIYIRIAIKI